MKQFLAFVPILIFLLITVVGSKLYAAGSISPIMLIALPFVALLMILLSKPKKAAAVSDLEKKSRGEFARNAFRDDPKLEAMFRAAIKDFNGNMPKAALNKLTKLAPMCTGDQEVYAVSMATAQCYLIVGKPLPAIREYTRALTIHPTPEVALELGSCHQRLGNLDKARDSYEYALDLDENNLEAPSRIATTYVADHDFRTALEYANRVIDKDENNASALATAAICHGLLGDSVMCAFYTRQAMDNGYSQQKIESTIATLKKRVK